MARPTLNTDKQPLRKRLSPSQILEEELRRQLTLSGFDPDEIDDLPIHVTLRARLETFLWRDIQYFNEIGYGDYTTRTRALDRLRVNTMFTDTVSEIIVKLRERETESND